MKNANSHTENCLTKFFSLVLSSDGEKQVSTKIKSTSFIDGLSGSAKLWIGKDYVNFIVKDFNNLDLPYQGNSQN